MKNKKIIYILIAITAIIIIGVGIYWKSSSSNTDVTSLDTVFLNQQYMNGLYSVANNKALSNEVGIPISYANSGYKDISNTTPLIVDNKPAVVFLAEGFCPYCAIQRWSIVLALMRFGNFTGLRYETSSAEMKFSNTPTFALYNSTYTSDIISFFTVETHTNKINPATNNYYKLQTPNKIENDTFFAYDPQQAGPFLDFGNRSIQIGAVVSPGVVKGMNWNQILNNMKDPKSIVSQSLVGGANLFTARICEITNNTPSNVCSQPYVVNYEKQK